MLKTKHARAYQKGKQSRLSKRWQLQEAKAKFSEMLTRAQTEGPQFITRHEMDAGVLLSKADYEKLIGTAQRPSLVEVLLSCPKGADLLIERDRTDFGREPPSFD